jgi:lipoprotein-anchoring transpeptidase ErfK/SrfK
MIYPTMLPPGPRFSRRGMMLSMLALAACANPPPDGRPSQVGFADGYGPIEDPPYTLPGVPKEYTSGLNHKELVQYDGSDPAWSIVVDPYAKYLYHVHEDGNAMRYPIAVGREGKGFHGDAVIRRKEQWPGWVPTANMVRSEPEVYAKYKGGIEGGLASPLGARALYLYRGGRDTYFRIHGTNDLASIGHNSSAGCIRLFNQDIIELYNQTDLGTRVRVRTLEESVFFEGEATAHRGDDMAPTITSIDGSTPPIYYDQNGNPLPQEPTPGT